MKNKIAIFSILSTFLFVGCLEDVFKIEAPVNETTEVMPIEYADVIAEEFPAALDCTASIGASSELRVLSNNYVGFLTRQNECLNHSIDQIAQKLELPIELNSPLPEGMEISKNAKIYIGDVSTFSFDVTNKTEEIICLVRLERFGIKDSNETVLFTNELGFLRAGMGVLYSPSNDTYINSSTCIEPRKIVSFSHIIDIDLSDTADLNTFFIEKIGVSNAAFTQSKSVTATEMLWDDSQLSFEFFNASDSPLDFTKFYQVIKLYDEHGYFIKEIKVEFGTIVPSNEAFVMSTSYDDIDSRIGLVTTSLSWEDSTTEPKLVE